MASSDEVEEVRRRTDIADVVGAYVTLKRVGHLYKGLCPFHNEKTPSFQVNPDKGLWYCFGQCSEGGDVFKFVQKIENLSFPEALERLAKRAGVILSEFAPKSAPGQRERHLAAVEAATQFYEETLSRAQVAKDYLEQRGLGVDIQRSFRIGYAGEDSDALMAYLVRRHIATQDAVETGLVVANDYNRYRDKLWGRIVFPIIDVQDRPIAFGGRLMESIEGRPKYLNSPETSLFSKGRTLYGLYRARKAIAAEDQAIVVEGYMDVVACHQAGHENVIATLGTALTQDHAALIKRYAQRVLLAFDADAAGVKAARKADAIFKTAGMETRMLEMPQGEDPDSLLRNGQQVQLQQAIKSALKVTEFQLRHLVAQAEEQQADEEARLDLFRREALPLIRGIQSVAERQRYIAIVAPLHPFFFTVNSRAAEEQIQQEIEGRLPSAPQFFGRNRDNWRKSGNKDYNKGEYSRSDYPGRDFSRRSVPFASDTPVAPPRAALTAQRTIIRALIEGNPEIVGIIINELEAQDLVNANYWKLVQRLKDGSRPMDALRDLEAEDSNLYAAIVRLTAEGDGGLATHKGDTVPLDAPIIRGCIAELRKRRLDLYEQDLMTRANEGDLQAQIELRDLVRRRKPFASS